MFPKKETTPVKTGGGNPKSILCHCFWNLSELNATHGSAAVVLENSINLFPVFIEVFFVVFFPANYAMAKKKKKTSSFYTSADWVPGEKWFLLNRTTVLMSSAGLRDSGCRATFVAFGSAPSFSEVLFASSFFSLFSVWSALQAHAKQKSAHAFTFTSC